MPDVDKYRPHRVSSGSRARSRRSARPSSREAASQGFALCLRGNEATAPCNARSRNREHSQGSILALSPASSAASLLALLSSDLRPIQKPYSSVRDLPSSSYSVEPPLSLCALLCACLTCLTLPTSSTGCRTCAATVAPVTRARTGRPAAADDIVAFSRQKNVPRRRVGGEGRRRRRGCGQFGQPRLGSGPGVCSCRSGNGSRGRQGALPSGPAHFYARNRLFFTFYALYSEREGGHMCV